MNELSKDNNIIELYKKVCEEFELPDYSFLLVEPYLTDIMSNYYRFCYLLKEYDKYDYLNNKTFRYLFIRGIFEGDLDAVISNFEYLNRLKEKGINILDNVEYLCNFLLYNNIFFLKGRIDTVEFVHSSLLESVPSEVVKEEFGDNFFNILESISKDEKLPNSFYRLIRSFSSRGCNDVESFNEMVLNNGTYLIRDVIKQQLTGDLSDRSYYYSLIFEDRLLFAKKYFNGNISSAELNEFIDVYIGCSQLRKLIGYFSLLSNKLNSIDKNVFDNKTCLFDMLVSSEYIKIFEMMLISLDSYSNDKEIERLYSDKLEKNSLELVNELCSKIHLFSYLFDNSGNMFDPKKKIMDVIKCLAQIKKDEIDGLIASEEAQRKANRLFELLENVKRKNPNIDFGNYFFDDEDETLEYSNLTIKQEEISFYAILSNEYFEKGNTTYLNIYDFIVQSLKEKNNSYDESFVDLVRIDPHLLNILPFDKNRVPNFFSKVSKVLARYELSYDTHFVSKIDDCSSLYFDTSLLAQPEASKEELNIMFDNMAYRYHSRLGLSDYYKNNNEFLASKNGIYIMKELYNSGELKWENDRIHTLLYFACLENNMAHDVGENVIFYRLREKDYFSRKNIVENSNTFNDFKKTIIEVLYEIKVKYSNVNSAYLRIYKELHRIFENDNIVDKRKALQLLFEDNELLVDKFLALYNSDKELFDIYFNLVIDEEVAFYNKKNYAACIVNMFYRDLFALRKKNNNLSNSLVISLEETKEFYDKYGYMIDIRIDEYNGIPVLHLMDKNLDIICGIHLKDVDGISIDVLNGYVLNLDESVKDNFSFLLKTSRNNRQEIQVGVKIHSLSIETDILDEYEGEQFFYETQDLNNLIIKYHLIERLYDYDDAYKYLCQCLKKWNENKIKNLSCQYKNGNANSFRI